MNRAGARATGAGGSPQGVAGTWLRDQPSKPASRLARLSAEDDNGKLDANVLGLRIEGVGTSNDERPLIGPPTWDGSKLEVSGSVVLEVTLRY